MVSYFEIIYQSRLNEINYTNLTTTSELYSAKLNFLITTLTEDLYKQGYAPFKTGLIVQNRYAPTKCQFSVALDYDYGLCVDPREIDKGTINNDNSKEENNYRSAFGSEGSGKKFKNYR